MGKWKSVFTALMIVAILGGQASMALAAEAGESGDQQISEAPRFVLFTDLGAGRFGGPIGAGLVLIGGALGISKLAAAAVESIARQPEAGGRIFTSMLITAAMIEGATFFAILACFMAAMK